MCKVNYKIVTKTIANRLKGILKDIISENQSTFIKDRLRIDNFIIGQECVNSIKNQKSIKSEMAALELDLSKAYDRVEWPFLREIVIKLGFDSRWVNLIIRCISLVSFSILINGEKKGKFVSKRGLSQGDPLSPYLFLFIAEGLSHLILEANKNKRLSGMVCSNGPLISHLLFADNSLVFCKANEQELSYLKHILEIYEKASGESINYKKSSILFLKKKTNKDRKSFLSSILGVKSVEDFGKYLGIPSFYLIISLRILAIL